MIWPVRRQWRSAASTASASIWPAIRSHAGNTWLTGPARALPVVAGDSGGAPEAVLPGVTGLVAAGRSVEATEAAVCYLLEDPERAKAMGQAGKEWVDQAWRWSHLVKPMLAELEA